LHGITSGALAGLASLVYHEAYSKALLVDFSKVVMTSGIISSCIFGCVLASVGYHFFSKCLKGRTDVWFNVLFLVLSFVSFAGPFSANLPMDIESPELFAGLTIPMHLFPVLFWLATKPLFFSQSQNT
jgi:hypothetical protein